MKSIEDNGTFDEAIASSGPEAQDMARDLRALIERIYPNAIEVAWPRQHVIGYGVGPKKMSEHFCYIGAFKQHVNLGFYYGVDLPDPESLLEGTGKAFRHVKIDDREQIEQPALIALLEASVEERKAVLGIE